MTNEEAKKLLIAISKDITRMFGKGNGISAFDLAIEALEKQIPKKPEYTDEYCDFAYCPNCEKGEFEFDTNTWEMKYCYECGQAIDWSDDNDV